MNNPRSLFIMLCGAVTLMIMLSLLRLEGDQSLSVTNAPQTGSVVIDPPQQPPPLEEDSNGRLPPPPPSEHQPGPDEDNSNDDFGGHPDPPAGGDRHTSGQGTTSPAQSLNARARQQALALLEQPNVAAYKNGVLAIYPATGGTGGGTTLTFIFAMQNSSIIWPESKGYFGGCIIDGTWVPLASSQRFPPSQVFLLGCVLPAHPPGEVEVALLVDNVTRYVDNGTVSFTYVSENAEKPPVVELAMATVFHNQALYLKEWIAFHTIFGFSKFYLYDQGSTDDWKEAIREYIESGLVVPIRWHFAFLDLSIRHQAIGFWHCVKTYAHEAKWIAFIDVDEFLFIPKTPGQPVPSVARFLSDFADVGGVMVDRANFGPNGHKDRPAGLVIENYTKRTPVDNIIQPGKSIVQPQYVDWAGCGGVHTFKMKEGWPNVDGMKRTRTDGCGIPFTDVVWDPIRINHYWTKSAQDWAERLKRDGNPYPIPPEELLTKWSYFTEEDTDIIEYAEETKRRMLWGVTDIH